MATNRVAPCFEALAFDVIEAQLHQVVPIPLAGFEGLIQVPSRLAKHFGDNPSHLLSILFVVPKAYQVFGFEGAKLSNDRSEVLFAIFTVLEVLHRDGST